MKLWFGISPTPYAESYRQIVEQVLTAERAGYDLVGIQDHPYQRRFLDTFSLIADLLARTERLRFFPNVASLPMRPPPMLAKAAASLDAMSGGRFELGIGAGNFWDAVVGMGGPRRTPGESLEALEEALGVVRAALDVGAERRVVRGAGLHYPVPGYPAGPPPAHRIEIWLGAMGPRALQLVGRLGDGWVPGAGMTRVAEFAALSTRIDEAAQAAGRDPRTIRRIFNVGAVTSPAGASSGPLEGPSGEWADRLASWALEFTVDAFVLWPADTGTHGIERFAAEVAPAIRRAVAAGRSAADRDPRIRRAVPGDAATLAAVGARTFADTFGPDNTAQDMAAYVSSNFAESRLAEELADPKTRFLVAEVDGQVAGYAKLHSGDAPTSVTGERPIELSRIYVVAEWLGRGIGAALMRRCIDEARASGAGAIWLGVWERNERAHAFYRKWGFQRVGEQAFVLGADLQTDWLMAREL